MIKEYDVYYATGGGPIVQGGSDVWVNHWIDNISPKLDVKPILAIHRTRPPEFENDLGIEVVWQGDDVGVAYGGTGVSTFTSNGILFGNGAGAIQVTAAGADTYFLKSNSGTPEWSNVIDGGTY